MTLVVQCDRCRTVAPVSDMADGDWVAISVYPFYGNHGRCESHVCPGCQTEDERAQLKEARTPAAAAGDIPF